MKPRQLKKLCKKSVGYFPQPYASGLCSKAWDGLKDQYRGAMIMRHGIYVKRSQETPVRVFAWARNEPIYLGKKYV